MKTILKIQTSLFGAAGQSSKLTDLFVDGYRKKHGDVRVVTRDLAAEPVPPLTLERFQAFGAKPGERSAEAQAVVDYSDSLIAELVAADMIVIGAPMYNFTIPAALHNYFDHIARAGVTFRYTENGPEGLIKGKQVVVFVTRGGNYGDGHSQSDYLRQMLAFIGLQDARFVYAERLAMGDDARARSLADAHYEIAQLAEPLAKAG